MKYLYNLVFPDKENQIPNILHIWVFVPLKGGQNFAAGMDFGT